MKTLPSSIKKLCQNNVALYPMPYQYVLFQNKHIPEGNTALFNKAHQLEKFVLRHNGTFEILSLEPIIVGQNLEIVVYFNCDVVIAKQIDSEVRQEAI